jgi:hypothetical protein
MTRLCNIYQAAEHFNAIHPYYIGLEMIKVQAKTAVYEAATEYLPKCFR